MAQADLNYCSYLLFHVYIAKKSKEKDRFSKKIEAKSRNFDGDL